MAKKTEQQKAQLRRDRAELRRVDKAMRGAFLRLERQGRRPLSSSTYRALANRAEDLDERIVRNQR